MKLNRGTSALKKLLAVLLVFAMVLLSVAFCAASAEEWVCPDCGKTNTTNFCTSCGAKHDVWICTRCGTENSDAFCGNCGAANPTDAQPESPAVVDLLANGTDSVKAGDIVIFGRYPQTAEGTDRTPIEWIVLEIQDGKALVTSRYGLDEKAYNNERREVAWESSDLRLWLNNRFMKYAFSSEEQAAIRITEVDNSKSQGYSEWPAYSDKKTHDQVFLLSYSEANRYFGVMLENTKARVEPTAYAVSKGAVVDTDYQTENGAGAGSWWLRSPGYTLFSAAYVGKDGSYGYCSALFSGCVRPALWIDLESEIFKSENSQ